MTENKSRRNTLIALALLLLLILLLLLRCSCAKPEIPKREVEPAPASAPGAATEQKQSSPSTAAEPAEVLTPATVQAPERVSAGAVLSVAWTGPKNLGDYVTIVRLEASKEVFGDYKDIEKGSPLELTAPMEPGAHEVRYVTRRSRTILGRAPVEVVPAGATLDAAAEVVLGAQLSVAWTGPNNHGDYVTIVPKETPEGQFGSYTYTEKGSPLSVLVPTETGEAELRYMTGQGNKVLARRPIRIVTADVSLSAPDSAIAGILLEVTWTGPNNGGDYVTVVPRETPDGQYANYTYTTEGSPLSLLLPIMTGAAELRYQTGQGNKVLARRPLEIVAATVTLSAPAEAKADSDVSVTWTGPNNPGDYITVVVAGTPDGQYGNYTATSGGSPLSVTMPKETGEAELRYMTGQGGKVLARRPIRVAP